MMIQASSGQPAMSGQEVDEHVELVGWILGARGARRAGGRSRQDLGGRSSDLRARTATSADERFARTQATRGFWAAHCSASVVFPARACHQQAHLRARSVEGPDQLGPRGCVVAAVAAWETRHC